MELRTNTINADIIETKRIKPVGIIGFDLAKYPTPTKE